MFKTYTPRNCEDPESFRNLKESLDQINWKQIKLHNVEINEGGTKIKRREYKYPLSDLEEY